MVIKRRSRLAHFLASRLSFVGTRIGTLRTTINYLAKGSDSSFPLCRRHFLKVAADDIRNRRNNFSPGFLALSHDSTHQYTLGGGAFNGT
jgi:hypothetical protein